MKSFFHHCGSYTMNIQSGGFCISTRLKRCRMSQRTPLKIGAWLFSASESGRFVFSAGLAARHPER